MYVQRVAHQAQQAAQNYCKELFAPHEVWTMVLLIVPVVMVNWAVLQYLIVLENSHQELIG